MKKKYIVPSVTVNRFKASNVIATSVVDYGGSSSDSGAPTDADAPRRHAIWDED